jgi:hypothetical protein
MSKTVILSGCACFAAVCLAVCAVLAVGTRCLPHDKKPAQSLASLLAASEQLRLHLYSGVTDRDGRRLFDLDRKIEVPGKEMFKIQSAQLDKSDRSHELRAMQADGEQPATGHSFYAKQPGEDFFRPHVTTVYDAVGAMIDEDVRHLNGSREKLTHVSEAGLETILAYAADGVTILSDKVIDQHECCDEKQKIKLWNRWRDEPGHTLEHEEYVTADRWRMITEYDRQHRALRVEHWAPHNSVPGTTITIYDPVTFKVRVASKADDDYNIVDLFDERGIRRHRLKLGNVSLNVTYYDELGTTPLFEQEWSYVYETTLQGSTSRRFVSAVTEFDAAGKQVRTVNLASDGKLASEQRYNVMVDGIMYGMVLYAFNESGTLRRAVYFITPPDAYRWKPDREQDFAQSDLHVVPPQANELVLAVNPDLDLPVPKGRSWGH